MGMMIMHLGIIVILNFMLPFQIAMYIYHTASSAAYFALLCLRTFHTLQGLPDHAHKPTLELLPKDLPVVGSPAAAHVVANMGFKNVFELDHGQSMTFCNGALQIQATVGKAGPLACAGSALLL